MGDSQRQREGLGAVYIGGKPIGSGHDTYVIAEIGINHNGDVDICRQLIDVAVECGCDAVKFQKRTPELAVPKDQWSQLRETPWGSMSYIDYKKRIELSGEDYAAIDEYCESKGIAWFASPWDDQALAFLEHFDPPCYKIASATLTDSDLLDRVRATGKPVILSTGMSTLMEIDAAVDRLDRQRLVILHCTSSYPARAEELNLRCIQSLRERYGVPVGYSGHEIGLQTTIAAVALGACAVERHVTLDRAMWGTDQAASVEPQGLRRLVRDIRVTELALGDGVKRVWDSELAARSKLRRPTSSVQRAPLGATECTRPR